MGGPCRSGYEIPLGMSRIEVGRRLDIGSSRPLDFGSDRRISAALATGEESCRREQLRSMADGRDWEMFLAEVADERKDLRIEPQVLRRATSGEDERIVLCWIESLKILRNPHAMPWFFAVRLVSFEVVNCRLHTLPLPLTGTDDIHLMAHHLQYLERNHRLVVFHEITNKEKDLADWHERDNS